MVFIFFLLLFICATDATFLEVHLTKLEWDFHCLSVKACELPVFRLGVYDVSTKETLSVTWLMNKKSSEVFSTPEFKYCERSDFKDLKFAVDIADNSPKHLGKTCDSAAAFGDSWHRLFGFRSNSRQATIELEGACFQATILISPFLIHCSPTKLFQQEGHNIRQVITDPGSNKWITSNDQRALFVSALLLGILALMVTIGFLCLLCAFYRVRKSHNLNAENSSSISHLPSFSILPVHSLIHDRSMKSSLGIKCEPQWFSESGISTLSSAVSECFEIINESEIISAKIKNRTYENICPENPSSNLKLKKEFAKERCRPLARRDDSSVHWSSEDDSTFSNSSPSIKSTKLGLIESSNLSEKVAEVDNKEAIKECKHLTPRL